MSDLLKRLIPAASAAALVAAIAHIISLMLISGAPGAEFIYIALLTYVIVFVISIPTGALLLAIVGLFRLTLVPALILFVLAAFGATVLLITDLFEFEFGDVPLQYAMVSIPATITAWYYSVYHVWKKDQDTLNAVETADLSQ